MGRTGSSSKRKHSKRKSLKVSSEVRRKKNRRNKSRKLRHHDDDSYSSYSDDESTSSSLVSSSSSEEDYKSRRSRSRSRNEVKGSSKKRTRRRSLSEDDDDDSHSLPMKKRKVLKKKRDSYKRKKSKKSRKKKSRRDAYTSSSASSDSDYTSCSTCSSDEERDRRSRGKKKNHRDLISIKGRNGNSSDSYDDDDDNIENITMENNSRRLKSIITIVKPSEDNENEEENDIKKDELKEEIVYDYDDYPSCKSNDSNEGETKKEIPDPSKVSPEKREVNSDTTLKENECKIQTEVDDLESILRQKALENLSRFRGGIQKKTLASIDNKQTNDQSSVSQTTVNPRSRFTWRRDTSFATPKEEEKAATLQPKLQSSIENNKIVNEKSKNVVNSDDTLGGLGSNDGQKSTVKVETPLEGSSKEQKTETNDNSQFEKKTMSVMRGGEMVQVSYKVYIPNRAPALARRQLKR